MSFDELVTDLGIDQASAKNLLEKGLLLEQLLQSERFVEFFNCNFDLITNEDKKEIFLLETPEEVVISRMRDSMARKAAEAPLVTPATEADLKKATGRKRGRSR